MTTPAGPTSPTRPSSAPDGALYDAVAAEHATIYGYGIVSAHSTMNDNDLVSESLADHRDLREAGIAALNARGVTPPVPAVGYQTPFPVDSPAAAAKLAVRMEEDSATAWRAVVEQASGADDRRLAVDGLTRSATAAAKWRRIVGVTPVTVAFPGGAET